MPPTQSSPASSPTFSPDLSPEVKTVIQEEERILAETLNSLKAQQLQAGYRLSVEEGRARDFTSGIVATRREEEKQSLASDEAVAHGLSRMKRQELADLAKLMERPYFARVVVEETLPNGNPKTIEYKIGNRANTDCRIIDWKKAPISKLYYEYQEGDEYFEEILGREREGKILLRNKLEISEGELTRISCRYGELSKTDAGWIAGAVRRRPGRDYGALPDILSLITAEQFRAITQDAESAVLIQGVAGSGKTSVALHRLQWLLGEGNSDVRAEKILVLVRSPVLQRYINHTLSTLGLANIRVETYEDWVSLQVKKISNYLEKTRHSEPLSIEHRTESDPGVVRVKRSFGMLRALEEYVEDQNQRLVELAEREIPWKELSESVAKELRLLLGGKSSNPLALCTALTERLPQIQAFDQVKKRLLLLVDDLKQVVRNPERILSLDNSHLLDHQLVFKAASSLREDLSRGSLSTEDGSLLVHLFQLKGAGNVIEHGFDHVIVDEVQDFSALELAVIIKTVTGVERLTLVGDAAQALSEESVFPGWDTLRSHYRFSDSLARFISLSVSFRSTQPIIALAETLSGRTMAGEGRSGGRPRWFQMDDEDHGVRSAIRWLEERIEEDPSQLVAVLTRSKEEAKHVVSLLEPTFPSLVRLGNDKDFLFEEGIVVTPIASVKGLEFPAVLIWDVSARNFPAVESARNLLYVAATRAEEHLALVTWEKESPLLNAIPSRLFDLQEQDQPEREEPLEGLLLDMQQAEE